MIEDSNSIAATEFDDKTNKKSEIQVEKEDKETKVL